MDCDKLVGVLLSGEPTYNGLRNMRECIDKCYQKDAACARQCSQQGPAFFNEQNPLLQLLRSYMQQDKGAGYYCKRKPRYIRAESKHLLDINAPEDYRAWMETINPERLIPMRFFAKTQPFPGYTLPDPEAEKAYWQDSAQQGKLEERAGREVFWKRALGNHDRDMRLVTFRWKPPLPKGPRNLPPPHPSPPPPPHPSPPPPSPLIRKVQDLDCGSELARAVKQCGFGVDVEASEAGCTLTDSDLEYAFRSCFGKAEQKPQPRPFCSVPKVGRGACQDSINYDTATQTVVLPTSERPPMVATEDQHEVKQLSNEILQQAETIVRALKLLDLDKSRKVRWIRLKRLVSSIVNSALKPLDQHTRDFTLTFVRDQRPVHAQEEDLRPGGPVGVAELGVRVQGYQSVEEMRQLLAVLKSSLNHVKKDLSFWQRFIL